MALPDYCRNLFGTKQFGDLSLVLIVADVGATGAVTLAASESSPEVTITRATTGQYALTFPKCQTVFPFRPVVMAAEGVGDDLYFETCLPAGTATLEAAVNTAAGTAADPTNPSRIFIALLCGAN